MFDFSFVNAGIGDYILLFFKLYFFVLGLIAISYTIYLIPKFTYRLIKKPDIKSIFLILFLILFSIFNITRNILIITSFFVLVLYSVNFIISSYSAILLKIKEKSDKTKKPMNSDTKNFSSTDYDYPVISILFPLKNESKIICNSIDKVFEIDYPLDKINIVVIDDHSTDNTLEVLNSYSKKEKITILENDQEPGKASSLNKALQYINTEFVLILDADHYMSKDFLKKGIQFFNDKDVALVQGMNTIRNGKRSLISKLVEIEYNGLQQVFYYTRNAALFLGSGGLFRCESLRSTGNFNNDIPTEDWEMSYRLHQKGYKIIFCNKISTFELAPEKIKDFLKQRYRWMRGTWTGVKVQFSNIIKSTNIENSKRFEILSLAFVPIILFGNFLLFFFYSFSCIKIISFPIDLKIILLFHIPFYIFNILGLIFAKNIKSLPFILFIPYQYLLYSLSDFEAMIDEWVFNNKFKGLKADRSSINLVE